MGLGSKAAFWALFFSFSRFGAMDLQEAFSELHVRIGECYEITRGVLEERICQKPSSCSSIPQREGSSRQKMPKPKSGPSV